MRSGGAVVADGSTTTRGGDADFCSCNEGRDPQNGSRLDPWSTVMNPLSAAPQADGLLRGLDNIRCGLNAGGRHFEDVRVGNETRRGVQPKEIPHGHLWCYRCHEIHHFLRFRDDWRERSQYRGYKSIFCIDCDRAYKREYREKNKAKVRKWNLKWCAANKPALRASRIARRTKEGPATREQIAWMSVLRADPCGYCGGPGGSVDHIVAVARGGRFDEDNLSGACRRCNASKGAMPLVAWLMLRRD